jgi:hypothetical protein
MERRAQTAATRVRQDFIGVWWIMVIVGCRVVRNPSLPCSRTGPRPYPPSIWMQARRASPGTCTISPGRRLFPSALAVLAVILLSTASSSGHSPRKRRHDCSLGRKPVDDTPPHLLTFRIPSTREKAEREATHETGHGVGMHAWSTGSRLMPVGQAEKKPGMHRCTRSSHPADGSRCGSCGSPRLRSPTASYIPAQRESLGEKPARHGPAR